MGFVVLLDKLLIFRIFALSLLPGGEDAFPRRKSIAAKPPAHGLCADIHRAELKHAVTQTPVPAIVCPAEEERENPIAKGAV